MKSHAIAESFDIFAMRLQLVFSVVANLTRQKLDLRRRGLTIRLYEADDVESGEANGARAAQRGAIAAKNDRFYWYALRLISSIVCNTS